MREIQVPYWQGPADRRYAYQESVSEIWGYGDRVTSSDQWEVRNAMSSKAMVFLEERAAEDFVKLDLDTLNRHVVTAMSDGTVVDWQMPLGESSGSGYFRSNSERIADALTDLAASARMGFKPRREPAFPMYWIVRWTIAGRTTKWHTIPAPTFH